MSSPIERVWWAAHGAAAFPSWTAFQLAAVIVGGLVVVRSGGRRAVTPYLAGVLLAALGAVCLGSGAEWASWIRHGGRGPAPELEIAGFGAIAGLVAGHVLTRRREIGRSLDVLAPAIGAMIAIARTGCFFAGCDFGSPTPAPWGLAYPPMTPAFKAQVDAGILPAGATHTQPVHPAQLYEACVGLLVFGIVLAMGPQRRAGDRFALAAILYAVGRLVVDVFRGDLAHGGTLGLTITQGLALAMIGAVIAWRSRLRGREERFDFSDETREI